MKIPQLFTAARRTARKAFHPETTRRVRQGLRKLTRATFETALVTAPVAGLVSQAFAQGAAVAPAAEKVAQVAPRTQWWEAIILGLVQGLTEFIPVSSSGHLNLTHWLLGHTSPTELHRELHFDVLLHFGTLAALVYYFRHDWKELLTNPEKKKLRNLVILACVPAALIGLPLRHIEDFWLFADPRANAVMLIVAGGILYLADKVSKQVRTIDSVDIKDALVVGASQAIALIPGVSRSGSTLTAGLFMGLKRADAARFSFLLSLPITLGAAAIQTKDVIKDPSLLNASPLTMALGILASAVSGFWAIGFLLNYLKSKDVSLFFAWRVVVGLAVLAYFFIRPPA